MIIPKTAHFNKGKNIIILGLVALSSFFAPSLQAKSFDKRLKWDKKNWGPLVPHKKFPKDCSICHVPKRWDVIRPDFHFDHLLETGYPLLGAHAQAACLRCHNDRGEVKSFVARGCGGCHVDPHRSAFGLDCTKCHNQTTWIQQGHQGEKIAQHASTPFPLTGMHTTLQCQQCHTNASAGDFHGAPTDCYSCHQKDFQNGPNHVAQSFPQTCQNCHNTSTWAGAVFSHAVFGPNLVCINCHQKDFNSAPNHISQNFSTVCQNCHNTTTWAGANFNHAQLGANPVCYSCHQTEYAGAKTTPASNHPTNGFPTTCQNCHTTTTWGPGTVMQHQFVASMACVSCHQADFNGAPNHVAQNFSTTCQNCHSGTSTWLGAQFDHTSLGPNPVCYSCHQTEYAGAKTTPASNHTANGFPTTCQNCHTTAAWGPGTTMQHQFVSSIACYTCHVNEFNGAKATPASNHVANGFPNTCQNCHASFTAWGPGTTMQHQFVASMLCYNCHQQDYKGAPNHVAMNFATTCQSCHTGTSTWLGALFDHSTLGANPVCYSCHQTEYASAKTTPASNHTANAFPTTCQNCHNFTAWGPGTVMQHQFVGGTAALCQTCHMSDYNSATTPVNHVAQGIAANSCNTCHTNFTTWTSFTHNPANCFNSATGTSHQRATCNQCHPGGNYATASCTACHANRGNSCN